MGDGAILHGVPAAQLERVKAEDFGRLVEVAFGGELNLHGAEGAEGARRGVVGVDAVGVDFDVLDRIGPAGEDGGFAHDPFGRHAISAAVGYHLDLGGGDDAVALQTHLVGDAGRVALGGGRDRLFAGIDETHRAARFQCRQGQDALIDHVLFAAETAADRAHDEAHFVDRPGEDMGQHVAVVGDVLTRRHHDQHVVGIDIGKAGLWLEIGVLDLLGAIGFLKNEIGLGKAFGDVALADRDVLDDVVGRVVMQDRGAGL